MLRTFQMALVFTYSLYVTTNFFQDIFNHIELKYYSAIYQSSEEKKTIYLKHLQISLQSVNFYFKSKVYH